MTLAMISRIHCLTCKKHPQSIWSPVQPPHHHIHTLTLLLPSHYTTVLRTITDTYKPHAYQTSQLNPAVPHPLPASQVVTSQPQCTPITFSSNSKRIPPLSPDTVNYNSLLQPKTVKQKYPKLCGPNCAGELAVILAVEAFFGPDMLSRCTVAALTGLPINFHSFRKIRPPSVEHLYYQHQSKVKGPT